MHAQRARALWVGRSQHNAAWRSSPATLGSNAHHVFAGPVNTLSSSCCVLVGVVTTLMWSMLACTVGVGTTAALAEHPGWIDFQSSISRMLSTFDNVMSSRMQRKLQIKAPNLCLSLHMLYMLHMRSALTHKSAFCICGPVPKLLICLLIISFCYQVQIARRVWVAVYSESNTL